jgi:hypothetical protein
MKKYVPSSKRRWRSSDIAMVLLPPLHVGLLRLSPLIFSPNDVVPIYFVLLIIGTLKSNPCPLTFTCCKNSSNVLLICLDVFFHFELLKFCPLLGFIMSLDQNQYYEVSLCLAHLSYRSALSSLFFSFSFLAIRIYSMLLMLNALSLGLGMSSSVLARYPPRWDLPRPLCGWMPSGSTTQVPIRSAAQFAIPATPYLPQPKVLIKIFLGCPSRSRPHARSCSHGVVCWVSHSKLTDLRLMLLVAHPTLAKQLKMLDSTTLLRVQVGRMRRMQMGQ